MGNAETGHSDALRAAKQRRIELKRAMSDVEMAAAAPSPDASWRSTLLESLAELETALGQHATDVEANDGLLDEIVAVAPRLHNRVVQLRREHPVLIDQTHAAMTASRTATDVSEVRAEVMDVLIAIARHRQHGSDLVYDAYTIDIGEP